MEEFDKLTFVVMLAVCAVGAVVALVFLAATWKAYRDAQIMRAKFLAAILFVFFALLVPVLILFFFFPRPAGDAP